MVFEDEEIRTRFGMAFPKYFFNNRLEVIVHPRRNTYFLCIGVDTEEDLQAKVLEWLSREAAKSVSKESQQYHLRGINLFLGTDFTQEDMLKVYTYLGNCCNHQKTLAFIRSGFDMAVLSRKEDARA